jgi:kynurenine formamidase
MVSRIKDKPLLPWEPPQYTVDALGKILGATPTEPHNWGRWGEEDQIGTVNLCTPERIAKAASLIKTGERFSLCLPIGIPTGAHPAPTRAMRTAPSRPQYIHFFGAAAGDAVLGDSFFTKDDVGDTMYHVTDDFILIALQHSTQLDGFGMGVDGALYNGYWAGLCTARSGLRRNGMHHRTKGIVGRALLLDVADHMGVDKLDDNFRIGPDLLLEVAAAEGVEIQPGDTLLIRTGWLGYWFDHPENPGQNPGISPRCIPLLAERDVVQVAFDNITTEVIGTGDRAPEPGDRFIEFHIKALRDLGLQIGEFYDLDELAAACKADGVYEMFYSAAPLPIIGGGGSPINPLAIK